MSEGAKESNHALDGTDLSLRTLGFLPRMNFWKAQVYLSHLGSLPEVSFPNYWIWKIKLRDCAPSGPPR